MLSKITVSPSPHIARSHSTQSIMLDVIIGLMPAMLAAAWFFRQQAAIVLIACVAACMTTEWICNRIRHKPNSLGDLSAVVTGIILALSLPPRIPVSIAVIGGVFCIGIAKMAFGGLGSNIFNPAMIGRTFLAVSFGSLMTTWSIPATLDTQMSRIQPDRPTAVTQATPLAWSKEAIKGSAPVETANAMVQNRRFAWLGEKGGCLGETSALAILLGGAYLLIRGTIRWHIPAAVLAAALAVSAIAWKLDPARHVSPLVHMTSGGLLLCAFFIATDPVTAPLSGIGMLIFGFGVGALILLIRVVGEYPEGVMYAVLVMNALSPLIDRFVKLVPAGGKPRG